MQVNRAVQRILRDDGKDRPIRKPLTSLEEYQQKLNRIKDFQLSKKDKEISGLYSLLDHDDVELSKQIKRSHFLARWVLELLDIPATIETMKIVLGLDE